MELIPKSLINSGKRALIRGYYGYKNIGDEAMLYVLISYLKKVGIECVVLSKNLEYTKKIHKVKAIKSSFNKEFIKHFIFSDILIEGPGNKHGFLSIIDLGLPFFAKLLGKKVLYVGVGLNPKKWMQTPTTSFKQTIKYSFLKRIPIKLLFNNLVDFISVRDDSSKEFLKMNGVKENKINVIQDLAFYLPILTKQQLEQNLIPIFGKKYKKVKLIGVSVRRFSDKKINDQFKISLRNIFSEICKLIKAPVKFIFIPFSFGDFDNDVKYSKEIISYLNQYFSSCSFHCLSNIDNPILTKSIIKLCSLIVGVRYHSHVFSESLGIPYLAIVYDPKSFQLVKNSNFCLAFSDIRTLRENENKLIEALHKKFGNIYDKKKQ